MRFRVLPSSVSPPASARNESFLITDNWNDWFKYETMYYLVIYDHDGYRHDVGAVKIGQFGWGKDQRRATIPVEFDALSDEFFSLGQDESYYENIYNLGEPIRDMALRALRDVVADPALLNAVSDERVFALSLTRDVSMVSILGQFQRLLKGGAKLSHFMFSYTPPSRPDGVSPTLAFTVRPESFPPTNVHVLIGRNGVGKTFLLRNMARALIGKQRDVSGTFSSNDELTEIGVFANLVLVAFSAFDPFEPDMLSESHAPEIRYSYVGLMAGGEDQNSLPITKTPGELTEDVLRSLKACRAKSRLVRLQQALRTLETDPLFRSADIAELATVDSDVPAELQGEERIRRLSSGHKIVLLTITRLVELVDERTLILLDEPEAHLHPPLLSAFIRALSDLLVQRNGVAIVVMIVNDQVVHGFVLEPIIPIIRDKKGFIAR